MNTPSDTHTDSEDIVFTDEHRLRLQQLRTLEWLAGRAEVSSKPQHSLAGQEDPKAIPQLWHLTGGVRLYEWQRDCVEAWLASGRGTVKVVTGAGKTLLALAIAEALQNRVEQDLRVVVVVPTIVLMNQWHDELMERSNLPSDAVSRVGGGHSVDSLQGSRIVIAVLATAFKELPKLIREAGWSSRLLLVVDEAHRAGATQMRQVLTTDRRWSLGLSATPEREGDADEDAAEVVESYDDSPLGKALGPIIYELTLAEALRLGIVPRFTIRHFGLPLTAEERNRYEQLSRIISDAQSELRRIAPRSKATGAAFFGWARSMAARGAGQAGSQAAQLVNETRRRKELLYRIRSRGNAVHELLRREFAINPDVRAILFHESIASVNQLFVQLRLANVPVVAEHSELPSSLREEGLELFRKGIARVVVSARSLIEGFNVPEADVGIIVASSSSVRQRIQSLGRLLRRHRAGGGEEATSVIHVLFAQGTVDEVIYEKADWDALLGAEANEYFTWEPDGEPVRQPGPPRAHLPSEMEIGADRLRPGEEYPGRFEGVEYSCDHMENITDAQGRPVGAPADLAKKLKKVKGDLGRFRVTPKRLFVVVRVRAADDWLTLLVTKLRDPLVEIASKESRPVTPLEEATWASTARPGDLYPFPDAKPVQELKFTTKKGGVIEQKVRDGSVWALTGDRASDAARGRDAERVIAAANALRKKGVQVSKFVINDRRHAVFLEGGQPRLLSVLEQGLEFPQS